jgi:hypothetical protein
MKSFLRKRTAQEILCFLWEPKLCYRVGPEVHATVIMNSTILLNLLFNDAACFETIQSVQFYLASSKKCFG